MVNDLKTLLGTNSEVCSNSSHILKAIENLEKKLEDHIKKIDRQFKETAVIMNKIIVTKMNKVYNTITHDAATALFALCLVIIISLFLTMTRI